MSVSDLECMAFVIKNTNTPTTDRTDKDSWIGVREFSEKQNKSLVACFVVAMTGMTKDMDSYDAV